MNTLFTLFSTTNLISSFKSFRFSFIPEAISLKKPALASDVCKRPEGTILFENRNIDDLYSKTIRVIDNYDEEKKKIENIEFEDNAEKILEVYRKVLNGK